MREDRQSTTAWIEIYPAGTLGTGTYLPMIWRNNICNGELTV